LGEEIPSYRPPEEMHPSAPPLGSQPAYSPEGDMAAKNLEIISAKLDALRASIDSINQRLANIERIATEEKKKTW
ncbi:hypothetical protein KY312_04590, partial [Candidatus Woesearchaeota archaeon]|nr:hypothetical protein [Candidatus Woesearchaeota archaeon]